MKYHALSHCLHTSGSRSAAWRCIFVCLLVFTISSAPAHAQPRSPDDILYPQLHTVDYNSTIGIPVRGFLLNTGLGYDFIADDNVFLTNNNPSFDIINVIKPGLGLQSNWNRHALFIGASGTKKDYLRYNQRDSWGYGGIVSGNYDITYGTRLSGYLQKKHTVLNRGNDEDTEGSLPVAYDILSKKIEISRALSYIRTSLSWGQDETEREDSKNLAADDYLKRKRTATEATISYEYLLSNDLFVTASSSQTEYSLSGGNQRDLDKLDMKYGWNYSFWDMYKGSVYYGRIYSEHSHLAQDFTNPYWGMNISWYPTRLTSASLGYNRNYTEGSVSANEKVVVNTARMGVTHSFTDMLNGNLRGSVADSTYTAPDDSGERTNMVYAIGGELNYQMSDNLGLKLGYDYRERTADSATDEYKNNRVMFSLTYMH